MNWTTVHALALGCTRYHNFNLQLLLQLLVALGRAFFTAKMFWYGYNICQVILWFDLKLIVTQIVSTVSDNKKNHDISNVPENPIRGKWTFTWPSFSLKKVISISILHINCTNYWNLVSNDWSNHKEQDDTCLIPVH